MEERAGEQPVVAAGHLYVVATPIGNLGDFSPRARQVLAEVDRICAEDTRTTGAMLAQFGLRRPMVAVHEHNETRVVDGLVAALQAGQSLALVSDAGTPLISDPGFPLVRAARAAELPVIAIPGPCAAIAALSISGIATDAFVFEGFLPARAGARRARLEALADEPRTLLFYESSHRIAESLQAIAEVFGGERRVCLARELSKRFEQSRSDAVATLLTWLRADDNRRRGEFVLVVEGAPVRDDRHADADRVLKVLLPLLSPAKAARAAAELTGARRSDLYARALQLAPDNDLGGDGEDQDS